MKQLCPKSLGCINCDLRPQLLETQTRRSASLILESLLLSFGRWMEPAVPAWTRGWKSSCQSLMSALSEQTILQAMFCLVVQSTGLWRVRPQAATWFMTTWPFRWLSQKRYTSTAPSLALLCLLSSQTVTLPFWKTKNYAWTIQSTNEGLETEIRLRRVQRKGKVRSTTEEIKAPHIESWNELFGRLKVNNTTWL